jgi:hypothetical protein
MEQDGSIKTYLALERDRFKSITLYTYFGEQVGRF